MEAGPLLQQQPYSVMQGQLVHPQQPELLQPQLVTQGQMPAALDGYGLQPTANSFTNNSAPALSGQKRDSSGTPVPKAGQDVADGNFVKLFVGSVPRTITEDEVRPLFAEHGNVLEVAIIKDKRTGNQQGCCFIKYSTVEEAERAIRALHNHRTLPGGVAPVQVRYADGERERLGAVEHKLFVGSLNKQASEKDIEELFVPFGRVDDVYIMRDEQKQSRGCAFIKYPQREMAQGAINALNGIHIMPVIVLDWRYLSKYSMHGCDQPLAVRFADPKRPKGVDARVGGPGFGGSGFSPRQGQQVQGQQGQQGPGGPRPMQTQMGHPAARGPPLGWRPMGGPGGGPPPQGGPTPYGAPAGQRGGPITGVPQMGGMMAGPTGMMNGHAQVPLTVTGQVTGPGMLAPPQMQANQVYYQQQPPQQRPQQQYTIQPPPQQQQQMQQPYMQMPSSQQAPQGYVQQQPQLQQQPQQQQPQVVLQLQGQAQQPPQQQPQHLPMQAMPQQMGQLQPLQPGLHLQQQQPQQMYYQVPLAQPLQQQQQQPTYVYPVQQPQTLVTVPAPQPPPPQATCDWTEHTSPEGYKYYYNGTTGESKWEKPEELLAFEQQQQIQLPLSAVTAAPQQYTGSAVMGQQYPVQGLNYMQPQPVNGSVEQPRQQGPPGANLFVFRIPDDFTDEIMKDTFAPYGNVISARVGVERESGRNRGYGFVSFDSAASAEAAIQGLNNVPVGGRRLKVERKRGEESGVQAYQQQAY